MRKPKYYSLTNINKTDAQYKILLGERSNGKSFAVKYHILQDAYRGLETGTGRFIYLRRWIDDIKMAYVESYFSDLQSNRDGTNYIAQITGGNFDGVKCYQSKIYFYSINEDGEIERDKREIGRYCALNEDERYKSQSFVGYSNLVYEEFITNKIYLVNEPSRLLNFVSTVARHDRINVYMIGNTLTRVCPYFYEWCLTGVLQQKIGTIDVYHFDTTDGKINIAVERCQSAQAENKMYFGRAEKQIVSGEWEVVDVPHLPKKLVEYERIYEILIEYHDFKFVLDLLVDADNGGRLVYIYPYTRRRHIDRVISDRFNTSPNYTMRLDTSRKPERLIYDCFRLGNVCYSDNLTGADFANVNKYFMIGVQL